MTIAETITAKIANARSPKDPCELCDNSKKCIFPCSAKYRYWSKVVKEEMEKKKDDTI